MQLVHLSMVALHNKAQVQVLNVFLYVLGSEQCVQKHFPVCIYVVLRKKNFIQSKNVCKMFASSLK